jgi:hypothetical protein
MAQGSQQNPHISNQGLSFRPYSVYPVPYTLRLFVIEMKSESLWVYSRGLPRMRHTGRSRYPEKQAGFRVKHGMTGSEEKRISRCLRRGASIPF